MEINPTDKTRESFVKIEGQTAQKLFITNEPRSRVKKNIVSNIKESITSYPEITHPQFIKLKGLRQVAGTYYLMYEEDYAQEESLQISLKDYFQQKGEDVSLEEKVKWALEIAEVGQEVAEKGHVWPGISLNCLRIDTNGQLRILPPEVVDEVKQYNRDMENVIPPENYTPPELIEGESWSLAGSLYSFGILLYYLVTGKPPFSVSRKADTYDKILASSYIKPQFMSPHISPSLSRIIKKLLYKNRSQRYQSWQDVKDDLEQVIENDQIRADAGQYKKNNRMRKVKFSFIAVRDRVSFFLKRSWKIIAAGGIMVIVLLLLGYMTAPDPLVTEEHTPQQVVRMFYQGLQEKDEELVKAVSSFDLGELESLISEAYIMEQMYRYSEGIPMVSEDYQLTEREMVYGLKKLTLAEIENNGHPVFRARYVFFINDREQGQKTEEMEDVLYLEKEGRVWQITEIEGGISNLIGGEIY